MTESLEGHPDARGLRFAVVGSRVNGPLVDRLVDGAVDCLRRHAAPEGAITVVRVPGVFEIPLAARALARSGRYDALVCVGVLIRGETLHFELLAHEVTRALSTLSRDEGLPVGHGVVAADTAEQALERTGEATNRGFESALAALTMADLLRRLGD